tara:strand:+ start:21042 stop:22262 length:1221 start_codon:yes stop_codon:yes gene_type:complete
MNKPLEYEEIPVRRFGRTEIKMPILSLGGMRFQQSWKDLEADKITLENQACLENILKRSVSCGLHHIETARHYGTSELQLGKALNSITDHKRILQTKIPPKEDPKEFEAELELSFKKLQVKRVELLAIHGLNLPEHLDQVIRPRGCLDVVRRWQKEGLIGHVGFSTHAPTELILDAIQTNEFDFVNLHWYFIRQENSIALDIASKFDLGVFIISPTDKGGHLHTPSEKLIDLCSPLHPIVFNDLFCLREKKVHTISFGASSLQDFDLHLEAINLLEKTNDLLPKIEQRLKQAQLDSLGESWVSSWHKGLPNWDKTPGGINIPTLLWMHNLLEAWEMEGYAKARYGLLGNGGHWFPGSNAECLDNEVSEEELKGVLLDSPWRDEIPDLIRKLRDKLGGKNQSRLSIH